MEELQDAIEDAQYINAMHDDTPRPTKGWLWPTQEEIEEYSAKLKSKSAKALGVESMCEGSLGFYLYMKYCTDNGSRTLVDFIAALAALRMKKSTIAIEIAKKLLDEYVVPNSSGPLDRPKRSHVHRVLSSVDPNELKAISFSVSTANNAISVAGNHVDEILQFFSKFNETNNLAADDVDISIFNKLDIIVFEILKEKHFSKFLESPEWTKYLQFMCMTEKKLTEDDFFQLRVVGRGGFGQVYACKKATTGKLYAMKVLSKKRIKLKKAEKMCITERDLLTVVDSPYLVCLKYAFTTVSDVLLILDLMIGGDLGYHLAKKGQFSLVETKYYAARMLLGIAALHEKHIIYRDLKPENVLVDVEGYSKISDFGLSCKIDIHQGISGTCGTRGYWAPEMIRRSADGKKDRYHLTADWFSYGCCIYEFLVGINPFRTERAKNWGDFPKNERADKERAVDLAILEMEPDCSMIADEQSRDLIMKLLCKDSKVRLGSYGYKEIMEHSWFYDINWDQLETMKPPFRPDKEINVVSQSEIGNFSDDKAAKKVKLEPEDHKLYENWDFVAIPSYEEEIVEFLSYEEIKGPIKPNRGGKKCCVIS